MNIQIPQEVIAGAVTAAIFEKLTHEQREALLKASLAHLVEQQPTRNAYGQSTPGPSPLQEAFNREAANMLSRLARERLEADPKFKDLVDGILDECLAKFYVGASFDGSKQSPREALVERIVSNMAKAFEGRYS